MKLNQSLEGKKVRLTSKNSGKTFEGKVTDYVYPEDNEPEGIASVIIWDKTRGRSIEFLEPSIKSIEIVS